MLDEKMKLEQYFEEEIHRVSNIEIEQIESEIGQIRARAIENLESDAQREAGMAKEQEIKELQSEFAILLSKTREETNRKLMGKREELTDAVFTAASEKIRAFTESKEYAQFLKQKAGALAKYSYEHVTLYLRKEDESYLKAIMDAYGNSCEGKIDPSIQLGGLRLECDAKGIVIDETFDTALEEQKDWFYTNSGLFIK